jgi:hypothetical protein
VVLLVTIAYPIPRRIGKGWYIGWANLIAQKENSNVAYMYVQGSSSASGPARRQTPRWASGLAEFPAKTNHLGSHIVSGNSLWFRQSLQRTGFCLWPVSLFSLVFSIWQSNTLSHLCEYYLNVTSIILRENVCSRPTAWYEWWRVQKDSQQILNSPIPLERLSPYFNRGTFQMVLSRIKKTWWLLWKRFVCSVTCHYSAIASHFMWWVLLLVSC